jgi:hypothetical protein
VNTSLTSPVTVQAGGVFTGSGSTSGNLIVQTGATLSARLMDWNTNTVPFSVVQLVAAGATGWTVKADATGITGFTETARTFALVATSNGLMDVNPSAITLDVTGLPGNGLWKTQLTGETLSLVYTPELYAAWTAVTDWNGRDSSPTADPDADGLVNLLEYALGGAPTLPGVGQLPAVTLVAGKLRLFFQRVADPQLLYEVIASDELSLPSVDWEVIWSSTGALNTAGIVTVDDSANASARRFLRLRVIR